MIQSAKTFVGLTTLAITLLLPSRISIPPQPNNVLVVVAEDITMQSSCVINRTLIVGNVRGNISYKCPLGTIIKLVSIPLSQAIAEDDDYLLLPPVLTVDERIQFGRKEEQLISNLRSSIESKRVIKPQDPPPGGGPNPCGTNGLQVSMYFVPFSDQLDGYVNYNIGPSAGNGSCQYDYITTAAVRQDTHYGGFYNEWSESDYAPGGQNWGCNFLVLNQYGVETWDYRGYYAQNFYDDFFDDGGCLVNRVSVSFGLLV